MREILFRSKSPVNGEWVSGFLVDEGHIGSFLVCEPVRPETVGQYTGLTDKNGKPVFEGDILSSENGTFSNTGMGRVLYYKGMWTSYYGQDALDRDCFDELHTVCEARAVIGNIHDNPELLGGGIDG